MKHKSGCFSAAFLCASAVLAKYLIVVPEYMVKYNGNSAWMEMLLKCCMSFIFLSVILWLYAPFEGKSYMEVAEFAMGGFGKVFVNTVYALGLILYNAAILRILIEALRTVGLNTMRYEYYALFILAAVSFGAYMGTDAVTNISTVVFPIIVISLITISAIMIPHYRLDNLLPVFGKGAGRLGKSLFTQHWGFFECMLIFFIAPRIGSISQMRKTGGITILIVTVASVLLTLSYCLVVPYPASETFFLPFYQLSRTIRAGSFLQRLEPLVVFVWTAVILCSMSTTLSLASYLLSGGSSGRKAFVPLTVIITFFISMLPSSELQAFNIYEVLLRYGAVLFPIIPIFVFLAARIRRAGKRA